MSDSGTLTQIASIIAAFGVAMLFFRISREVEMDQRGEAVWIPLSDWLLIWATVVSLLVVLLPVLILHEVVLDLLQLPRAACAAAVVLVAGYIFGILAHYRIILGQGRSGSRTNPEPSELIVVQVTAVCAAAVAGMILMP